MYCEIFDKLDHSDYYDLEFGEAMSKLMAISQVTLGGAWLPAKQCPWLLGPVDLGFLGTLAPCPPPPHPPYTPPLHPA